MALAIAAMAGAAANTAAAAPTTPTGAPSNGSLFRHSGTKIGVQWTNGDVTSSTEVRYKQTENPPGCPSLPIEDNTTLIGAASPGATTFNTTDEDSIEQCSYFIAHKKGGVYSAWHQVTTVLDSGTCLECATA